MFISNKELRTMKYNSGNNGNNIIYKIKGNWGW